MIKKFIEFNSPKNVMRRIQKFRNLKSGVKFLLCGIFLNPLIVFILEEYWGWDYSTYEFYFWMNSFLLISMLILHILFWGTFQKDNKDA